MSPLIPDKKHRQVLNNCVDVPEEIPSFPLALQKVGIAGKTVWVGLDDNDGGHLPFTARIMVDFSPAGVTHSYPANISLRKPG